MLAMYLCYDPAHPRRNLWGLVTGIGFRPRRDMTIVSEELLKFVLVDGAG